MTEMFGSFARRLRRFKRDSLHTGGFVIDRETQRFSRPQVRWTKVGHRPSGGFTLLELLVVVAVAGILMAIALPSIKRTMTSMHLSSATSSLTGAMQGTRYLAISSGCPVAMTISTTTYQLATETIAGTPPTCGVNTFSAFGGAVPYASSDITLNATQTLQFNPNGTVTLGTSLPADFTLVLSNGSASRTITLSGVGNVKVQ